MTHDVPAFFWHALVIEKLSTATSEHFCPVMRTFCPVIRPPISCVIRNTQRIPDINTLLPTFDVDVILRIIGLPIPEHGMDVDAGVDAGGGGCEEETPEAESDWIVVRDG